ncbi:hypothetical protein D9757_010469 [Collybiopsis confluens]|uniref:NADH dehydrogenase [ubiquinone] 1 alpha subcomplex assembly factor 3 n=1 Tax=Collybiopsis confluens TaxID=2823264 RepID=A0A8H5GQU4_9AGAR|nr:hypothetical protein D9757_010469 [Collybiopsis confluens]
MSFFLKSKPIFRASHRRFRNHHVTSNATVGTVCSTRMPSSSTYNSLNRGTRTFRTSPSSFLGQGSGTSKPLPFTNILASDIPPPVQVASVTPSGIQLTDGLIIPGPVVFLEGKVFLWDVPRALMSTGSGTGSEEDKQMIKDVFEIFECVIPKPEILLLGTGKTIFRPPSFVREYLNDLGIQLDVMDTRNACSTYNLLSEEGRRVAAALLPLTPRPWQKLQRGLGAGTGNSSIP